MRYDQVNHALTFLTKPGDMITLQVPYHEDVDLVVRHITNVMGRPRKWVKPNIMVYPNGIIHLESVCSNPLSGFAQDCLFFIDRDHDRSYLPASFAPAADTETPGRKTCLSGSGRVRCAAKRMIGMSTPRETFCEKVCVF